MVIQPALLEDLADGAQRVPPGVHFARRGLVAVVTEERGLQLLGDLIVSGVAAEMRGKTGVEAHVQSSVYFRLLPRDLSTGYRSAFRASFPSKAAARSIPCRWARRTTKKRTSAASCSTRRRPSGSASNASISSSDRKRKISSSSAASVT